MSSDLERSLSRLTVAKLAEVSGRSVRDILIFALTDAGNDRPRAPNGDGPHASVPREVASKPKRKTTRKASSSSSSKSKSVRPRSEIAVQMDDEILAAIRAAGAPMRAEEMKSIVGGTPELRRAALGRLVASNKLKKSGTARATVYELA